MRLAIVHIDGGPGFSPLCGTRAKRAAKQAKVRADSRLTALERWREFARMADEIQTELARDAFRAARPAIARGMRPAPANPVPFNERAEKDAS